MQELEPTRELEATGRSRFSWSKFWDRAEAPAYKEECLRCLECGTAFVSVQKLSDPPRGWTISKKIYLPEEGTDPCEECAYAISQHESETELL